MIISVLTNICRVTSPWYDTHDQCGNLLIFPKNDVFLGGVCDDPQIFLGNPHTVQQFFLIKSMYLEKYFSIYHVLISLFKKILETFEVAGNGHFSRFFLGGSTTVPSERTWTLFSKRVVWLASYEHAF